MRPTAPAQGELITVRVLGVDPGTRVTGYGVVERNGNQMAAVAHGAIRPRATAPLSQRYVSIHRALRRLIARYQPEVMAIEGLFYCKNVRSAMALSQARGVALLAAAQSGLDVYEYAPRRVKQAVVGRGAASKHQVLQMVSRLLGLPKPPTPEDAADALAVAICHLQAAGSPRGGGERT